MRKVSLCLFLAAAVIGSVVPAAENLIREGDFETLRADRLPDGPVWAWRNGGSGKLEIALSDTEKHSGARSLHLLDSDRGKSNDGLTWMMAGNVLARMKGRTLRLSCWVRQVRALRSGSVGIGFWLKRRDGKTEHGFAGPETTGETVWSEYALTIPVPDDAEVLLVFLHCANGWGNDGEAFFDGLRLSVAGTADSAPVRTLPAAAGMDRESAFFFLRQTVLPLWSKRYWGGLYLEQGTDGHGGLRAATVKGTKAYAGVGLYCPFANRLADLSAAGPDAQLFCTVKPYFPLQVQLSGRNVPVAPAMRTSLPDGATLIRVPLAAFGWKGKIPPVDSVALQFTAPLPAGTSMQIRDLGVTGLAGKVDTRSSVPGLQARAETLSAGLDRVWTADSFSRPEIRHGTFYFGDRPTFMLGPWIDDLSLVPDFGPNSQRECMRGRIYDEVFNPGVAAEMGFNSFQLSAAARLPYLFRLGLPWGRNQLEAADALARMLKDLKGMPYIQDYAWINGIASVLKRDNPANCELMQQNADWHEFIPLCPEHPRSREIYAAYFRTGTAFALAHGGNPFIYEIFNESNYRCACRFNREGFARSMEAKFRDIGTANRSWRTQFRNFPELAKVERYEKFPAVWAEWCVFLSRRYAAILREFGGEIRKVDRRPNIYLTEQLSVSSLLISRGASMDYRMIADELEVLTTEGGWQFGQSGTGSGNPMEDAMMSSAYPFIADFFAALGKGRKPVVNNEHYCVRSMFGKRVPSRKEDLLTAMWAEVFYGVSGSFPYAWGKRVWEWHSFDEAKAMVYNGGYKASHLLNPYSWPRPALDGFRQFADEIARLGAIALPQPRRAPGRVALVYSYPSFRMTAINHENFEKQLLNCYFALLYAHYPLEIVFAGDMTAEHLRRFDAVVLPSVRNAAPATVAVLREYAAHGGVVVGAGRVLSENEYAQPLDAAALLGVRREAGRVTSAGAVKGSSGIWINRPGTGCVYYLPQSFEFPAAAAMLPGILAERRVGRYFSVRAEEGKPLHRTEVQVIDRGGVKLLLLVNWEDRGSRLVRVAYGDRKTVPPMYLSAPLEGELYLNGDRETWDDAALRRGFTVMLPPQTRTLLLLSAEKPAGIRTRIAPDRLRQRFEEQCRREAGTLAAVGRQEEALNRERLAARNFAAVRAAACVPLDLSRQATAGFQDELAGDRQGGWFDQGDNDYRQMPLGLVRLAGGVPFRIIDPKENGGRAAIILRGAERPYFPARAEGIEVGMKVAGLYLLHTAGWSQKTGAPCYELVVNYADGSRERAAAGFDTEIGGWWQPKPLPDAKIAHESANLVCKRVGLYCWRWNNPHPERVVRSLTLEAGRDNAVPAIVAVTAEKP